MKKILFLSDFTPIPGVNSKLHLDGKLASAMMRCKGISIVWVRTNFCHYQKKYISVGPLKSANFEILEFWGYPYAANTSFNRVLHNVLFALCAFWAIARHRDADLVISPIPSVESTFAASIASQLFQIRHDILVYDKWPDIFIDYTRGRHLLCVLGYFLYFLYRPLLVYSLRRARRVHCVSIEYRHWISRYVSRPSQLIYIGCNSSNVNADSLPFSSAIITVSYIGSWGGSSDIDTMLKAAQLLLHDHRFNFILAGCVNISTASILYVPDNVQIVGWLGDKGKHELLSAAHVGLMVYHSEALQSLPNKLFEYIEYGCFVISTLQGEARCLLKSTALGETVLPESPEEIAAALIAYARSSPLSKKVMAAEATRRYGDDYFDEYVAVNF